MRDIASPLDGFRSPFGPQRGFNPARLFAGGVTGLYFDALTPATMYRDAVSSLSQNALTNHAVVGQTVDFVTDLSAGGVAGGELIANGTFDTGTEGWVRGFNGEQATFEAVSGQAVLTRINNVSGSPRYQTAVATQAGEWYQIGERFVSVSGAGASPALGFTSAQNGTGGRDFFWKAADSYRSFSRATASTMYIPQSLRGTTEIGANLVFDDVTCKPLPGRHAAQTNGSYKAAYQTAPDRLVFDGGDDRYDTFRTPTETGSIAARIRGGTASRVVIGAQSATDGRCYLGLAADGAVAGGIGAQSSAVIKGATDRRGQWVTACLTWDGSTVTLYEDGIAVYSAAQSGAVTTTVPFLFGAMNANGTPTAFWDDDVASCIVTSDVITAAEAAKLHIYWSKLT